MKTTNVKWDLLIKNALVFDGSGHAPQSIDIAVLDGKIAAKGIQLPAQYADNLIDASGQWLMPGLLDIHTHLDLEVEINPGLHEAVRHGTTTAVIGNCSIGAAFGAQIDNGESALVSCFTRVENIPKSVLQKVVKNITWNNTQAYLEHFNNIKLGPNLVPLIPHSMLRVQVMGLDAAIQRQPTPEEQHRMAWLLEEAMNQGYAGFSTDGLPFHYLANAPHKDKRIPSQHANNIEIKELLDVVRKYDRVWQTTPFTDNILLTAWRFLFTSGRLYKKPLKVTALSALDFAMAPKRSTLFILRVAKFLNSNLIRGNFHFQALSTQFRVWANGVDSPMLEELPSTSRLIACERDDREGRKKLLNDPAFVEQFKKDWYSGRRGFTWEHFKSKTGLGAPQYNVVRDIYLFHVEYCPFRPWQGSTLGSIYHRLKDFLVTGQGTVNEEEATLFNKHFLDVKDEADFFLQILRLYDTDFRWWVDIANKDHSMVKRMLRHKYTLPGFNDSGAHLTNLAFWDGNLITLKIAQEESLQEVSRQINRLTKKPAEFFGLDIGTLDLGAQADMVLINPTALASYDSAANRQMIYSEIFQHQQLVNRSDGVVSGVWIAGEKVWSGNSFTPILGKQKLGRILLNSPVARQGTNTHQPQLVGDNVKKAMPSKKELDTTV